jgi:hypothetical protein
MKDLPAGWTIPVAIVRVLSDFLFSCLPSFPTFRSSSSALRYQLAATLRSRGRSHLVRRRLAHMGGVWDCLLGVSSASRRSLRMRYQALAISSSTPYGVESRSSSSSIASAHSSASSATSSASSTAFDRPPKSSRTRISPTLVWLKSSEMEVYLYVSHPLIRCVSLNPSNSASSPLFRLR